jgi:hypothetical protein
VIRLPEPLLGKGNEVEIMFFSWALFVQPGLGLTLSKR